MDEIDRRLRRIRFLAFALAVLSLLVVLVSAYIRLRGAGLGCTPWPECYGQILGGGPHPQSAGARILHRLVASLALVLGFVLAWQCLRPAAINGPRRPATALLGLMILLTFVGVFSADPHRVWASSINILGGAGLVLLSWRTFLAAFPATLPPASRRAAPLLHAGLGLLGLTLLMGALIGARYAAPACPSLPGCGDVIWPTGGWAALNPIATIDVPAMLGDAGGAALHLLHRWSALAAGALLAIAGLQAMSCSGARGPAAAMLALLLLQATLGILTVVSGFGLGFAVAHSVGAAALLAAGLHLLLRVRALPA